MSISGSLTGDERINEILAVVEREGRVLVADVAKALAVSSMTIRRDLELLDQRGLVRRVRGGAVAAGPRSFADRHAAQATGKARIAEKLLALVGEGGAIGIDASSTLQRLAGRLQDRPSTKGLTVVTNGPDTFTALQGQPGITALLTGGQLDPRTGSLIGPLATRAAHDLHLRRLFVSAAGVDPQHGSLEAALEEADVKLALASVATEIVLAVDHTKLYASGPARCFPLERIGVMVTDLDPADDRLASFRDHVDLR